MEPASGLPTTDPVSVSGMIELEPRSPPTSSCVRTSMALLNTPSWARSSALHLSSFSWRICSRICSFLSMDSSRSLKNFCCRAITASSKLCTLLLPLFFFLGGGFVSFSSASSSRSLKLIRPLNSPSSSSSRSGAKSFMFPIPSIISALASPPRPSPTFSPSSSQSVVGTPLTFQSHPPSLCSPPPSSSTDGLHHLVPRVYACAVLMLLFSP
ncbi:hypothetical protein Mapa_013655 [Marchantia paleacea]|nr:hypothetical protein Mapa_013655 [Marchantia paleacea]